MSKNKTAYLGAEIFVNRDPLEFEKSSNKRKSRKFFKDKTPRANRNTRSGQE